ncbi:chit-2a [Spodoptera frugiperda granulovirus]|uniref:Chit-2a n=1 Tax=Spodoptera frugiperda granulovirus TaxID=307454 RepID=A0A0C5ASE5_9BBAC|nr:chit-2a [Spodoptera frugiperda granulovirus]AJK91732.1 chit-2a [Spodoptera frugiperda granulovirus]
MFVWITVIIIVLIVCVVLFNSSSSQTRVKIRDPQPDMNDCSKFTDMFGMHVPCQASDLRYDEDFKFCVNYYVADCGERPNPPYPTSTELCEPFVSKMILGVRDYPVNNAEYYVHCDTNDTSGDYIRKCEDGMMYDIVARRCRPTADLYSRCIGADCPVESKS